MSTKQPEFVINRLFDAPRERVWQAWTDPKLMAKWWGPKGFKVKVSNMDLRPGGTYHYCMQSPDGNDMWGKFVYREVVKPERLVLVNSFSDAQGNITRHPMSPSWPREMLSTFTFSEENGQTKVTVTWIPLNPTDIERKTFEEGMASMQQGWTGTMDQFAAFLAADRAAA